MAEAETERAVKKRNIDLTEGVIWKGLALFFLPILAGSLLQHLYATADAVIVGRFVGKAGLAAIDSINSLLRFPVNFFSGLATGATIVIGQLFGAKRAAELSRAAHTAVAFAFAGGAALSVAGVAAAPACLRLLGVPQDIYPAALAYARIYFGGLAASMLYNVGAGVLRAVGDSRTPLRCLAIASAANIALDLLCVGALGWGAPGAAAATVACQLMSAVLVLRALVKTDLDCRLDLRAVRLHGDLLRAFLAKGLPIALQSALYPVSNMTIQSSVNALGTDNIAAWALCGKLDVAVFVASDTLASAVSTFSAQNYGARAFRRLKKGVLTGMGMTIAIVAAIAASLYLWCEPLGALFLRAEDRDILALVGVAMRFVAPFYPLYVVGEVLSCAIIGAGETVRPMILTLVATCASRVAWILFVVPHGSGIAWALPASPQNREYLTILACYPASWLLAAAAFSLYYARFQGHRFREPSP